MGLLRPDNCCWCISLPLGTLIIGFLSIIQGFVMYASALAERTSGEGSGLWIATWTITTIFFVGVSGLLVAGVLQRNPVFITPYLVVSVLMVVFDLVVLGVFFVCMAVMTSSAAGVALVVGKNNGTVVQPAEHAYYVEARDALTAVSGSLAAVALVLVVCFAVQLHLILVVAAYRDQLLRDREKAAERIGVAVEA